MSVKVYKELVIAMGRTGIVGYGGGPSIIPLIRHEAVTRYQWIDDEEFAEILALANTLPGPIATKMAAYLGYHAAKTRGAVVALLAHITPSVLAMVLLFGTLTAFRQSPIVHGMIGAVDPVVVVMLGIMAYDFAVKSVKGLGRWLSLVFALLAFVLLQLMHVPVGIIVLAFLAYGAFHLRIMLKIRGRKNKGDESGENGKEESL